MAMVVVPMVLAPTVLALMVFRMEATLVMGVALEETQQVMEIHARLNTRT